jgi:hypothetical protein
MGSFPVSEGQTTVYPIPHAPRYPNDFHAGHETPRMIVTPAALIAEAAAEIRELVQWIHERGLRVVAKAK